jgi:hypothetical protein
MLIVFAKTISQLIEYELLNVAINLGIIDLLEIMLDAKHNLI